MPLGSLLEKILDKKDYPMNIYRGNFDFMTILGILSLRVVPLMRKTGKTPERSVLNRT